MHALDDFFYFSKVVEHGGYARAARALGIPKSRLSRHVAALETR
ncbi:MAG TPA: LysR family transcriptional regulator, partial [Steroidobacteraceae bacterium]|nr:LysR family transcriptional regulator [Steroidobacteraceae bacterium]